MSDVKAINQLVIKYNELRDEIKKVIVGQDEIVEQGIDFLYFLESHALLVGVPGLAKTLLVHTVADVLGLNFKRIQFYSRFNAK